MLFNKYAVPYLFVLAFIFAVYLYLILYPEYEISAVVLPHHDIVATVRNELLKELSGKILEPKTIILISPNHFDIGMSKIQLDDRQWITRNGKINSEKNIINSLLKSGLQIEKNSFAKEHGITTILSDIKEYFPDAEIVPVILKRDIKKEKLNTFVDLMNKNCEECLMIASVDFSHYQPALLADLHDDLSVRALKDLDSDLLMTKAEVDSPEALYILSRWATLHNTNNFSLFENTNSGFLFKNSDIETTTHVFGYYDNSKKRKTEKSVTFTIGGDFIFTRAVQERFFKNPLESLEYLGERFFWGTDLSLLNFEGVLSQEDDAKEESDSLKFIFPKRTMDILKHYHINAVSLANNHSNDAGKKILLKTKEALLNAGIKVSDFPRDEIVFNGHGLSLHLIAVDTLKEFNGLNARISDIKKNKNARVIIFPHWGIEYAKKHDKNQEKMAHDWIDAGADLIVGSHPHVVQDTEVYKGVPIIYSLGNFLFDQNFSDETQKSLILSGKFTDKSLDIFLLPLVLVDYKPRLEMGEKKKIILNKLYAPLLKYKISTQAGDIFRF